MQASSFAHLDGFVFCRRTISNALLYHIEGGNKFPLLLSKTALSTQATFGSFQLNIPEGSVVIRKEEPCSKFKPLASFLLFLIYFV